MTSTVTSTMTTSLTFRTWTSALARQGFTVLPTSHAVPVELWLRAEADVVLHFRARGTTVALRHYTAADLTGLILRSECDCEEHRTAGAGTRTVLAPNAAPSAEAGIDGRTEFGWTTVEAGLLDVPTAAELFDRLVHELDPAQRRARGPVAPGSSTRGYRVSTAVRVTSAAAPV